MLDERVSWSNASWPTVAAPKGVATKDEPDAHWWIGRPKHPSGSITELSAPYPAWWPPPTSALPGDGTLELSSMGQDVVPDNENNDERKDGYRGSDLPEDLTLRDPQHNPPAGRAPHSLPHLRWVAEIAEIIIRSTIVMATCVAIQVPDCRPS